MRNFHTKNWLKEWQLKTEYDRYCNKRKNLLITIFYKIIEHYALFVTPGCGVFCMHWIVRVGLRSDFDVPTDWCVGFFDC